MNDDITMAQVKAGEDAVVERLRQKGLLPAEDIVDQPPPITNSSQPIWELVIADMDVRDHVGRARYGMPLQAHNGRDALVDLYQELLDAVVYMRQVIEERKSPSLEHSLATTFVKWMDCTVPAERTQLWQSMFEMARELKGLSS